MNKMRICIIGGGSQAHILSGFLGSQENVSINVLTRKPGNWSKDFTTIDLSGKEYKAELNIISDLPEEVVPQSDILLFCLPGYAIKEQMIRIKPFLSNKHIIGTAFSGTGFFFDVLDTIGDKVKCFGFQRVPFTGRVKEYGRSATLKGYKPYLAIAQLNCEPEFLINLLTSLFEIEIKILNNIFEVTLSNSNPLLHPSRLYVLYKDWHNEKVYEKEGLVYDDWDDESSKQWIACDEELQNITKALLPLEINIETVLDYYGCKDYKELTAKIKSIEPFKGVKVPMIKIEQGFILNNEHRYFIEDIPFGLIIIKSVAEQAGIDTPQINKLIEWGQSVMNKEFILDKHLTGKDIKSSGYIDNKVFQTAFRI